ncbi:methyltransferase [Paenibacillus sp. ISL-20]|uniref:methyltransferase n=1 Tax=Paenibacillus sp. ISL-20 TaxID=2819163 RepID=UPI001BEAE22A|nr:methyltransferase [Paenibacillus sp. ISL-20]MBT2759876.1 methyltransferase [Paenibacillus sp. ISL-20]
MYYGDKREAKVKIMGKLVEAGWKVYGYTPDESDFMTDYYSPAHWSGIATKNGYVLLIDVYSLSDSGREIRKYNYNNKQAVSNARIEKLTAMMNDEASTENEKVSCATLIEKELEKGKVEPSYTVEEVYPTFTHANPKGTTWHIEKDGQIIAKGKGVFSTNTYDWENKELSSEKQKEIKINAFVERIEKVLKDSDALQPVIVKVPVKATKMVEKDTAQVTNADIKEGFTFIMKVGYTQGKSKGNKYTYVQNGVFSKLGKNNKPSKSFDKMWSPSVERLNELLGKGHIAIIEFVEVVEYQEKTVFKKTARKQTVSSAPAIETTEEVKETVNNNSEENEVLEPATKRQLWALHCATKIDTRAMKISKAQASELITKSKAGNSIIEEVKAYMSTNETTATDKEESNNEVVKQGTKEEQNQEQYINKIDKQIESLQKKLDSISGEYLTNTWKRQNEETSREEKRKQYRFDISLLQLFRDKAAINELTQFEIALLNNAFREDIRGRYNSKTKHNFDIKYPEIDPKLDLDGWWNLEVPKRQKRYNKANIYNTEQLTEAVNKYGELVKAIETPTNPIQQQIKKLENEVKLSKISGFFPTPKNIVQRMIELADIKDGETILEPSAGNGNILDGVSQHTMEQGLNVNIEALEWNYKLSEILELKQYKIVGNDFTEFNPNSLYDKVIMNPPFEKNQDIDHVLKAYDCLKDGGKLVAIMSPHWTFASDSKSIQFREWLSDKGTFEKLPEGSFKESGTGVNTVLVVIEKSSDDNNDQLAS